MDFLKNISEYQTLLSWILGGIFGTGIIGALYVGINKRDNRLIQQGKNSILKDLDSGKISGFQLGKQITEKNSARPLSDIDYFNAYGVWRKKD